MPLPLLQGYLTNIRNLRAEENLISLTLLNDPKPTWQIDYKKSKSKIGQLAKRLNEELEQDNPYWENEKLDREGLHRLKGIIMEAQTRGKNV